MHILIIGHADMVETGRIAIEGMMQKEGRKQAHKIIIIIIIMAEMAVV